MENITVKVIEYYAESLKNDRSIGSLPRLEPGAAARIVEKVGRPLATSPDLLERHVAIVKAFYILNTPPYLTYVRSDDHKAMKDLASAVDNVLEQIPEGYRKATMHIMLVADREFKRRHVALARSTQRQIRETQKLLSGSAPDLDAIRQKQDEIQKAMDRLQQYEPIDILDRVRQIRSHLEYLQQLGLVYEDKEKNWKDDPPPAPMGLADLGRGENASPWAAIFGKGKDPSLIARQLIVGDWLPGLFDYHFAPPSFGVGWNEKAGQKDGPGMRFLIACTREAGIMKKDGTSHSVSTLAGDVLRARKGKKDAGFYRP